MSKYIDFEDPQNRDTYTGRTVDPDWLKTFERLVHPHTGTIADLGCGGGLYTKAIAAGGASFVVGIDSSRLSLESARENCHGLRNVAFLQTDAEHIAAADNTFDTVIERALIHHFPSVTRNFTEARRTLKPGGILWIQDRTVEDALLPPSDEHIRGWYLVFDDLLRRTEQERRRHETQVTQALQDAGFTTITTTKIRELRKVFNTPADLRDEILTRRGRSLLHKLDDNRLADLATFVQTKITHWPVTERDTWTVWTAHK